MTNPVRRYYTYFYFTHVDTETQPLSGLSKDSQLQKPEADAARPPSQAHVLRHDPQTRVTIHIICKAWAKPARWALLSECLVQWAWVWPRFCISSNFQCGPNAAIQRRCFENHCPNYFSEMVRTCDSVAIGPFIYLLVNCLLSVWKPGVCPFPLGPGSPTPALASFQIKPLSDGLSLHWGLSC